LRIKQVPRAYRVTGDDRRALAGAYSVTGIATCVLVGKRHKTSSVAHGLHSHGYLEYSNDTARGGADDPGERTSPGTGDADR